MAFLRILSPVRAVELSLVQTLVLPFRLVHVAVGDALWSWVAKDEASLAEACGGVAELHLVDGLSVALVSGASCGFQLARADFRAVAGRFVPVIPDFFSVRGGFWAAGGDFCSVEGDFLNVIAILKLHPSIAFMSA